MFTAMVLTLWTEHRKNDFLKFIRIEKKKIVSLGSNFNRASTVFVYSRRYGASSCGRVVRRSQLSDSRSEVKPRARRTSRIDKSTQIRRGCTKPFPVLLRYVRAEIVFLPARQLQTRSRFIYFRN